MSELHRIKVILKALHRICTFDQETPNSNLIHTLLKGEHHLIPPNLVKIRYHTVQGGAYVFG